MFYPTLEEYRRSFSNLQGRLKSNRKVEIEKGKEGNVIFREIGNIARFSLKNGDSTHGLCAICYLSKSDSLSVEVPKGVDDFDPLYDYNEEGRRFMPDQLLVSTEQGNVYIPILISQE